MNVNELIVEIQKKDPELFEKISNIQATVLIRDVFKHIAETLQSTEAGIVHYPGLGNFRVEKIERQQNGETVASKRIIFHGAGERKSNRALHSD